MPVAPGITTYTSFFAVAPYSVSEALTINFLTTAGGSVSVSTDTKTLFAAPEPGTIAMALTALPVLALVARARRRRAVA
jgi:hypothetical protein